MRRRLLTYNPNPNPPPRPNPTLTLARPTLALQALTRCPVAFCTAELKRPSAVVLDDALRCQLAQLPADAAHFWYGPNGEVQSAAALPSGAPRKRKRVELKKEPHPQ